MPDESIVSFGVILIIVGVLLAFIALFTSPFLGRGKTEGGAVVIIGPFPIVFGSNQQITKSLLMLAILLFVSLIIFFLIRLFLLPSS